jgi:glycosyltransferase involved in cell wall biosynthesis
MKKKIAYIINHSAFFYSHIYVIANKARKKNYSVKLFCGEAGSKEMDDYANKKLADHKIKISKHSFKSSGINVFSEFKGFLQLLKSIKNFQPDIIHCATPKGILFGGFVCKLLRVKSLVIFNSGMGYHKNKKIVVENKYDYNLLKKNYNLIDNELNLVCGSGINLNKFKLIKKKKSSKIILFPARVIKEKGIEEFIYAAKLLKKKYPDWKFLVAGAIDYDKNSNYSINKLKNFNNKNQVKFLGYVKNMNALYQKTSIVCLPSYREGFSRTLQEAAAFGIPIVTSDVIGCRDAIIPGKTGLLCKPRNYKSLQSKLENLILNKKKRLKFGSNGRKLAEKEFNLKKVLNINISIYEKLIRNEK